MRVHEKTPDGSETVWEGDVEVFELVDHPRVKRCYAWSVSNDAEIRGECDVKRGRRL